MTKTPLIGDTFFGLDLSTVGEKFWTFQRKASKRFLLLEFGLSSLTLAQARFTESEVNFQKFKRISLPDGATERGVPTEPERMAALLRELCKEEKIPAHRAAVVLPPEALFTKLIDIPSSLSLDEARDFAANPSSGVQIPIPLQQTDFDLLPLCLSDCSTDEKDLRTYLLTSAPKKLVDQLIATLQLADLELHAVDVSFACQLRLIASDLAELADREYLVVLELLPDCTHCMVVGGTGAVLFDRLVAIREFSEPSLSDEQSDAAIAESLSGEAIVLAQDSYLPISELDLRVLVQEVRTCISNFSLSFPDCFWKGIPLTGINSAHPLLTDLLASAFNMPVQLVRPLAATGVGAMDFSQLLVTQGLGRLVGLGLRLLPHQALVACSLTHASSETYRDISIQSSQDQELALPSDSLDQPLIVQSDNSTGSLIQPVESEEPIDLIEAISGQQAMDKTNPSVTELSFPAIKEKDAQHEDSWPSIADAFDTSSDVSWSIDRREEERELGVFKLSASSTNEPWPSITKEHQEDAPQATSRQNNSVKDDVTEEISTLGALKLSDNVEADQRRPSIHSVNESPEIANPDSETLELGELRFADEP